MSIFRPYLLAPTKGTPQGTIQAVDVAARHLVYKLFEETNGRPGAWQVLGAIRERPETVAKAAERGWLVVRQDEDGGRVKAWSAALTDEGRLVARRGLRG